jgi:hypothetical protein
MDHAKTIFIALSIFLVIGVSMTGCSDNPDAAAPASSDTVATPATAAPLYTAGDIVRSATGSVSPAWLVVGYDPATDSYTRALIYRNADDTWGYRLSGKTEISQRTIMEKVYTVKIAHVAVSSIPTAAPTTVTTEMTTVTTVPETTTSAAATTTTTQSAARPAIKAMDPEEGEAGTTVSTVITGSDFSSNLTAKLRRSGETSISAGKVVWASSAKVTCTFEIPNTTKVGTWDIVVTNSNGLSGEIANYFLVRGNKTAG